MLIEYGIPNNYLNITHQVLNNSSNPILIPSGDDDRNLLYGDPVPYRFKHIHIAHGNISTIYEIGEPVILYMFSDLTHTISVGSDYQMYSITDIVYSYCYSHELLIIPSDNDGRSMLFGDQMMGIPKQIMIDQIRYDIGNRIAIYIPRIIIYRAIITKTISPVILRLSEVTNILHKHHTTMKFEGGNQKNFYELQLLVALFIQPQNTVLQLDADIGYISLTISHILNNTNNLLALTSKYRTISTLIINRDLNNYKFHIENATLGYDILVLKGDDIIPYHPENMNRWGHIVKTVQFDELVQKYQLKFDTLVAGNLWHLKDHLQSILTNINTVIVSNGYYELEQKHIIDDIFRTCSFHRVYFIKGGWGPCFDFFYEAWLR